VFDQYEIDIEVKKHRHSYLGTLSIVLILLRGFKLTHVQRYRGSTVKMELSYKIFTVHEANKNMALPNACRRSVRALSFCYHNNNGSQTTVVQNVEQT
jgi:hypothetical protein